MQELFAYAQANQFALPGVNVTGTNTVNAALETARDINSPIIVQFSNYEAYRHRVVAEVEQVEPGLASIAFLRRWLG